MIKRRVFFIIILLFLFITSFVFYTNKAFLYSPIPTHYNLTQEMIKLYNLTYDPDITIHQAELIIKGSVDEDILPRSAFHLYDPVYNRAPFGVYTAKKWVLDSNAQTPFYLRLAALKKIFTGTFLYHGDYSWSASVNSWVKNDLDNAYYGLGHILHLIEDITVPAHTRNDTHPPWDAEPYEKWAGESTKPEDYIWAESLYGQGYRPRELYFLEDYFDKLARYSNKYFFSKDTILSSDYKWPKVIKEKEEDHGRYLQRAYIWGRNDNGELFRLAARSGFKTIWYKISPYMEEKEVYFIDEDDQKLNHGYWERLAPKVIIYGAGVIRLFMKDIEWEKEVLAQKGPEPSFFQKAQTFVKNILGIREEDKKEETEAMPPLEPWPLPEPSRLPKIETVVIQTSALDAEDKPIETPLGQKEEEEAEASEEEQEEKKKEVKYGGFSVGGSPSGTGEEEQEEELELHILINEIAWMGTTSSSYDEWIELYNRTNHDTDLTGWVLEAADGTPIINLTSNISANGYYLLERTDDETISNIIADQIYTGALENIGENLILKDVNENIIDQVDCSDKWYTGDNEEKRTMERINPDELGTNSENWQIYTSLGSSAIDVGGNPILGTPKAKNSSSDSGSGGEEEEEESEPELHLVINEIQIRDNEFVELYNSTDIAISLASYSFSYYSESRDWNDPYRNKEFPVTASISAGGYYLIGILNFPESGGNPDADWQIKTNEGNPYSSGQLSNISGSIAIFPWPPWDPSEKTVSEVQVGVIDVVAWGEVEIVKEGTSFQETIGIDKSIQRKDNGQDTNDNSIDFELQKIPSPTNSKGETRIPGTYIPDDTIISENTTWTIAGSPYYIELNANQLPIIEESATLTIEPGVVVMPQGGNYTFLEIQGTLIAEGTEDEKIVFTSIKDSDYGGEGGAEPGDWMRILFTSDSTDSSIKNAIFRYGGEKEDPMKIYTEMIKVDGGSITMEDVTMEKSQTRGLHLIDSNSKIENSTFKDSEVGMLIEGSLNTSVINNCSFENNSKVGLEIKYGASPVIKNNQFNNNGEVAGASDQGAIMIHSAYPEFENNQTSNNVVNGILVHWQSRFEQDATWQADLPYILVSNAGEYPTVASGSTLTLEPEIILKPYSKNRTALLVEGTLIAEAASNSEIVFTSLKDDSFEGDTNNDGDATSPGTGDWKDIKFVSGSEGVLDHVFLYYGTGALPVVIEPGASVEMGEIDYEP